MLAQDQEHWRHRQRGGGGVAKPAGGREKTKNRKQGPAGGAGLPRVEFCLESWVPEVFGVWTSGIFEDGLRASAAPDPPGHQPLSPSKYRLSRVLFSSTGGPGPAGSGQRTLHHTVFFVFCFVFGGPGPSKPASGGPLTNTSTPDRPEREDSRCGPHIERASKLASGPWLYAGASEHVYQATRMRRV